MVANKEYGCVEDMPDSDDFYSWSYNYLSIEVASACSYKGRESLDIDYCRVADIVRHWERYGSGIEVETDLSID